MDQCKAFGPRRSWARKAQPGAFAGALPAQDGQRAWSSTVTSWHYQLFSSPEVALDPNLTKLKIQPVNFPFRNVTASDDCEYLWPNFEIERLEMLHSMRRTELLVALSAARD
jgi:hypothetical protein